MSTTPPPVPAPESTPESASTPPPAASPAPTVEGPAAGVAASAYASRTPAARAAIWVAIGALVAVALVCVVWVLVGPQNGTIGRAFFTIVLLAGFAGMAIFESTLAPRRPSWFAIASIVTWVLALFVGIILIWMPEPWSFYEGPFLAAERIIRFLLVVLILQLALLHSRYFVATTLRPRTPVNRVVAPIAVGFVILLTLLLLLPLVFGEWIDVTQFYWRVVVSVAILAAVASALVPLIDALFAPRAPGAPRPVTPVAPAAPGTAPAAAAAPAAPVAAGELLPWPMYVDGITPLPMLPDGSPDWNAYYTGHPTPGAQVFPPIAPPPTGQPTAGQPPAPAS